MQFPAVVECPRPVSLKEQSPLQPGLWRPLYEVVRSVLREAEEKSVAEAGAGQCLPEAA